MTTDAQKTGAVAALDAALEDAPDAVLMPLRPAEQLTLLAESGDRGDKPVKPSTAEILQQHQHRAPGRPKGAKNKSTEELRKYILSQHAHPVLAMAQIYSRPTELLSQELDCHLLEAAKLQVSCMNAAAPYLAQKMPQAVELQTETPVMIGLAVGGDMALRAEQGGALMTLVKATNADDRQTQIQSVETEEKNIVENQEVSEASE